MQIYPFKMYENKYFLIIFVHGKKKNKINMKSNYFYNYIFI